MRPLTSAALLLCLAASAHAGGYSGNFDAVEAALVQEAKDQQAVQTRAAQRRIARINKALRNYGKPTASASYVGELGRARALISVAGDAVDNPHADSVAAAIAGVHGDMVASRDALFAASEAPNLTKRARKRLAGKVSRADKALGQFGTADEPRQVALLRRVAKFTRDFETLDPDPGPGVAHTWVINSMTVATDAEALDLDGDGVADNKLDNVNNLIAFVAPDQSLDAILKEQIETAATVTLLRMWGVVDITKFDTNVAVGLVSGNDTDGNPADNFSGSEAFDVPSGLDEDQNPIVHANSRLAAGGGAYAVVLGTGGLTLGGLALPGVERFHIDAKATATSNAGVIGFAIPSPTLNLIIEGIIGAALAPDLQLILDSLLDIDLDGDGEMDALSANLKFTSVRATINEPPL